MDIAYPRLVRRVQAVLIDSVILPVCAIGALIVLSNAGVETPWLKVASAILVVLVLEPVLVSVTGGTIGHHLIKLRVRRAREDRRLNLGLAIVRFVLKISLGLPSLLFVLVSKKHQALHDLAADSAVVYKSNISVQEYDLLGERTREQESYAYASKGRRFGVIVIYWLLLLAVLNLMLPVFLSSQCLYSEICSDEENYILGSAVILWLVATGVVAYLGWVGKLYGCRKSRAHEAAE